MSRSGQGLVCAMAFAVSGNLFAAERQQPTQLEVMTVSGHHPEAPGANARVWDQQDWQDEPGMDADDALRGMPGFSLFRRSSSRVAHPTAQGVTVRGLASSGASRSLVMLDGLPLNDPFGGWVHWTRVSGPFEQLRVTPGGLSHVWGSTALAGLVELETINPDGVNIHAATGSRDERQLHVVFGSAATDRQWRIAGHDASGGGYTPIVESQRGAIDVPADTDHQGFDARTNWQLDHWNLRAGMAYFDEERSNGTLKTSNDTEVLVTNIGLTKQWDEQILDWMLYWQDQSFASRFSSQLDDRSDETPALDQFSVPSKAWGSALRWQMSGNADCGLDVRLTEGQTKERFLYKDGDFSRQREAGAKQDLAGLYCRLYSDFDGWALVMSARIDYWRLSDASRFEFERSNGSVLKDEHYPDRDDWALSPRVDFSRAIAPELGFRGAIYGALRAPTINELVRPFRVRNDITAANPALKSEKLNGVEAGLLGRHLGVTWSATIYYNEIEDAIGNVTVGTGPGLVGPCGFTPDGGSCRQRQNLDKLTGLGLELAASRSLIGPWSAGIEAWVADTQVDTGGGEFDPAQVPEYRASLSLRRSGQVRFFSRMSWVGSQYEDDLNQRQLDDYLRVDAKFSWTLGRGSQLYLAGENLLDEAYQVSASGNGLIAQGLPRTWHVGLRWQWDVPRE